MIRLPTTRQCRQTVLVVCAAFVQDAIPGLELLGATRRGARQDSLTITQSARTRFWARVDQTSSGCWIWQGAVGDDGYGRITWTYNGASRTLSTHRFALHLAFGPALPSGLVGAHRCDHPLCVRVGADHVHLSTQALNLRHAVNVGRHDGTALVVDSTRRRDESLRVRSALTGSTEAPPYPSTNTTALF